jgi:hypothetical protein
MRVTPFLVIYYLTVPWKVNFFSAKESPQNSELMEAKDLTGLLTSDENRVLMLDLAPYPSLQHSNFSLEHIDIVPLQTRLLILS